MKKQLLFAACVSLLLNANAQILYVPGGFSSSGIGTSNVSGNVGIGISNPGYKLTIQGDHYDSRFLLHSTGSGSDVGQADLMLWASEPGWTWDGVGIGNNVLNSYSNGTAINRINTARGGSYIRLLNNAMTFNLFSSSGIDKQVLYFNGDGNVGIGTASPYSKLSIQYGEGSLFSALSNYNNNGNYAKIFEVTQESSDGFLYLRNANGATVTKLSGYSLTPSYFLSNVGMGLTNPDATLEVVRGTGNSGTAVFRGTSRYTHFNYSTTEDTYIRGGKANSNVYINDDAGNVGIGTTDTKGYKLAVAGNIIATEVVVKAQANWPDFVFAPTYKLRSLSEVEQHIKDNGHLPDIAPAAEMQQNGVSVSEMQTKLLQKVEELTLYVIEQQKQIESLKQENQEIKKQIK